MTWLFMLLVPVGAYFELYVAPRLEHAVVMEIETAAGAIGALQGLLVVGPAVLGVALLRSGGRRRVARAGLILGTAPLLLLPALPGHPGVWIIAGTALVGVALAGVGALAPTTDH